MMRRLFLAGILAFAAYGLTPPQPTIAAPDPGGFIASLGARALEVLGRRDLSLDQKRTAFATLFHDGFDIPSIGRFVLGRYWRVATPQQQQEFLQLFDRYTVLTYTSRFSEYSGEQFRVTGTRPSGESFIVSSEIIRPSGGPPVRVDWQLAPQGGSYKITDVNVAGVSMGVAQRDEFASVIQRNGGQIQGLLNLMQQKVAAISQ